MGSNCPVTRILHENYLSAYWPGGSFFVIMKSVIKMFVFFNPNPVGARTGDCVIRAICAAEGKSWDDVYSELALEGYIMKDMPSSNAVWGSYLSHNGYRRYIIPDNCPTCYTVRDFAAQYNKGVYIIGTGTHAVAVIDGCIKDSWDSGGESPVYFYAKEDK